MVSAPEAASRVSVGAEESVRRSYFCIMERLFMLATVWAEFPHVFCAILALIVIRLRRYT